MQQQKGNSGQKRNPYRDSVWQFIGVIIGLVSLIIAFIALIVAIISLIVPFSGQRLVAIIFSVPSFLQHLSDQDVLNFWDYTVNQCINFFNFFWSLPFISKLIVFGAICGVFWLLDLVEKVMDIISKTLNNEWD